jgi:outer membrane protein
VKLRIDSRSLKNLAVAATFAWAALATIVSMGGMVSAQENAAGGQYKIAVVDRKLVFDSFNNKKARWDALENKRKAAEADLNQKLDALQKQVEAYKESRETMPEDARTAKENELNRKRRELQAESEAKQNEINREGESIIKEVTGKINEAIKQIGETEKYHLILEADTAISSVVFYQPAMDITPKVIAYLNGGASSAPAAAAPADKPARSRNR